jgi:polysaccharide export outer membrane protein
MRLFLHFVTVLTALILSACAGYQPAPPAFHAALNQPYILDAGDEVRVTVFDQANLTNTYAVDQAGYISMPLIGSVAARGHTAKQLEKAIAAAGGFTPRANQGNADITREINGKVMTGRVLTTDPLLPGDTVYVRERLF